MSGILFAPDGRPIIPTITHQFARLEPVRRRPKRHIELRVWCTCRATSTMFVRPRAISDCNEHRDEGPCVTYALTRGVAILSPGIDIAGHFEMTDPWEVRGPGAIAIFGGEAA